MKFLKQEWERWGRELATLIAAETIVHGPPVLAILVFPALRHLMPGHVA